MDRQNDDAQKQGIPPPTAPTHDAALIASTVMRHGGILTTAVAMKMIGFPEEDCKNKLIQRRVLWMGSKKMLAEAPPLTVKLNLNAMQLAFQLAPHIGAIANATQLNYLNAAREEHKERYLKSVAAGINMYRDHQSGTRAVHKSGEDIAIYVSSLHDTNITIGTICYRVWKQNTLQHDLIEPSADPLVTAMETHSNLMSTEIKKPNCQDQIQQLESCLKDSPSALKDYVALYQRLSARYAVEVDISATNFSWKNNTEFGLLLAILTLGLKLRILNIDETALTLDRTSTNAGSCRSVTEYGLSNRSLPRGCTRAQKSSWRCTAVARSTAAGDLIPLHFFQLKSNATEENKQISKAFTDEIDKSVDSGPSWSDPALHQLMSVKGFLLVAGVPNTTHVIQVTDVSYNPFKMAFQSNKKKLHACRRSKKQAIKTSDIPAQVFGYKETHEMMALAVGMIDVDADPKIVALLELERRNRVAVQTLVDHGFNGGRVYAKNAPHICSLKSALLTKTQPNTRAHQDALQKITAAGPRYTVLV
eukprot:jgi/Psemu1/8813/gm1.8813_g